MPAKLFIRPARDSMMNSGIISAEKGIDSIVNSRPKSRSRKRERNISKP